MRAENGRVYFENSAGGESSVSVTVLAENQPLPGDLEIVRQWWLSHKCPIDGGDDGENG